jgi:hypothetical protein
MHPLGTVKIPISKGKKKKKRAFFASVPQFFQINKEDWTYNSENVGTPEY